MSNVKQNGGITEADKHFLRREIKIAERAVSHGNHPFGALLVGPEQNILLEEENNVFTCKDCTGHAELNVVRKASSTFELETLAASTLYSSAEPCAMCAGALHWSGIGRLVYGLSGERLNQIAGDGMPFDLPNIGCREVFSRSGTKLEICGPCLEEEAAKIHMDFWK